MSEIMRREHWHPGRLAGTGERRPEPVRAEPGEDLCRKVVILARCECSDGREHVVRHGNPPGVSRLRHGRRDAPAAFWLVHVSPGESVKFADAHPGCVEHEQRKTVCSRDEARHRHDVARGRRAHLGAIFTRETDDGSVAGRVGSDAREVEDLCKRGEGLPDRFAGEARCVQFDDEARDAGRTDLAGRSVAERGNDAVKGQLGD